ncbi:hypothetical protein AAFN86_26620 [Roseomonas sp. CAU 1739]|uniref:hypothetical protein n=1 Tax=Roseomonas sp. CAU 1739 TaxID=3140364 RepID=UPI00325AC205
MAEARPHAEDLRRPWHGASDSVGNPEVVAIRLHRAEVEAMMVYRRCAPGSEEQARAWRRLATLRERRCAVMPPDAVSRLPPLPAAPTGAISAWQKLRRRFFLRRD